MKLKRRTYVKILKIKYFTFSNLKQKPKDFLLGWLIIISDFFPSFLTHKINEENSFTNSSNLNYISNIN